MLLEIESSMRRIWELPVRFPDLLVGVSSPLTDEGPAGSLGGTGVERTVFGVIFRSVPKPLPLEIG